MRIRELLNDRGQVLAFTAIALIALIALVGLAVDGGLLLRRKRDAQTAADSGAMAAGATLFRNAAATIDELRAAARASATLNGFTHTQDGVDVAVNKPPVSGSYAGDNKFVEVIVTQDRPTLLLAGLGLNAANVKARAVAGPRGSSPDCITALGDVPKALDLTGPANLNLPGCEIQVNSTYSDAINMSGSSSIANAATNVVGGVNDGSSGDIVPAANTGAPAEPDPFASRTPPSYSGCDHSGTFSTTANGETVSPGVYCGGFKNGKANVKLLPGTYIMVDGKFEQSGGGSSMSGTDVTIYLTTAKASCNNCSVIISGGGAVNLSAPTSGPNEGMLFWQDPKVGVQTSDSKISGGSEINLEGVLYFPKGYLEFSGGSGSNTADYTVIAAYNIKFTGASHLNSDFSGLAGGSFASALSLAE